MIIPNNIKNKKSNISTTLFIICLFNYSTLFNITNIIAWVSLYRVTDSIL